MALSDLAALGSFISGIAVVVTLVFLLLQLRQANLNQRALMQQMRSSRTIDTLLKASEPYLSEAMNRALANDADMDATQIRSFTMFTLASHTNWEDSFLQHRAGTLDESSFNSDLAILKVWSSLPSFRVIWQTARNTFGEEYRSFVDELIRNAKVAHEPVSSDNGWKERLAKEIAEAT